MTSPGETSRRGLLVKIGALFNLVAGVVLAVPIARYVLSPASRKRSRTYESWISLGAVDQFPAGETRFAVYRNPFLTPTDGDTGKASCWVRHVEGNTFQVFAINCTHLGCPVRWFEESHLFMCPCHGGAFYEDGSHASGPPPRGLYQYEYKIEQGRVWVRGGRLPTLSEPL